MGIENPVWETDPRGISIGGSGLHIKTEDIARFGQLYLQKGMWNGRQLVPASWVQEATSRQTSNGSSPNSDWDQGYGYQFWLFPGEKRRFALLGVYGQSIFVDPELKLVMVITAAAKNASVGKEPFARERDAIWRGIVGKYGSW